MAGQLQPHSRLRAVECGLEFHHDGTSRVDLGFRSQSRLLGLGTIGLPSWWNALVQASDPPGTAEVFGDEADTLLLTSETEQVGPREPVVRFGGGHFLEFDQNDNGTLTLSGIFQHCEASRQRDSHSWDRVLDHYEKVGCFPSSVLRRSKALQLVFDTFGIPAQWGLMVGRSEFLKVVAILDRVDPDQLQAFCRRTGLQPTLTSPGDLTSWCKTFARTLEDLVFFISLDLNLAEDRFAPTFGVEVSGHSRLGRMTDVVSNLDPLLQRCDIGAAARESLNASLQPLPMGQRERVSYGGLEVSLAEELRTMVRVAYLNHVKLIFRPAQPTAVKSYVALHLLRGGNPEK